ncbi:uncharacterized protein (DUF4415 family) [Burkholderia ambifaria]|nr:hypothetical protein [Burkholderia ambifaria]MDR6504242.1 uncharacterized protein (DUF4415 family) [Burkholderia ambifaria]
MNFKLAAIAAITMALTHSAFANGSDSQVSRDHRDAVRPRQMDGRVEYAKARNRRHRRQWHEIRIDHDHITWFDAQGNLRRREAIAERRK